MTNYIEELSSHCREDCVVEYTSRMYFGRCPFNFTVDAHQSYPALMRMYDYLHDTFGARALLVKNRVFFTEYSDALQFARKYGDTCISFKAPKSQKHMDILTDGDLDVEIRDSYFWGNYRYKVILKKSIDADIKSDKFYTNYLDTMNEKIGIGFDRFHYSHDRDGNTLFLSNYNDLVFVKVGLGEYIHKIKKAIKEEDI